MERKELSFLENLSIHPPSVMKLVVAIDVPNIVTSISLDTHV